MSANAGQELIDRALQLAAAGNLPAAVPVLRKAVETAPDNQEAWRSLGFVLGTTGNTEESIRCCTRALQMNPGDFEVAGFLASRYMHLGGFADAVHFFRRAIGLNPMIAGFHQGLGQALMLLSQGLAAEPAFRRAIELDPAGAVASYDGLAQVHLSLGQKPQAVAMLRKAHACDPGSYSGKVYLARALIQEENLQEAEAALREAISLGPELSGAYMLLGRVLQQLGNFEEAEVILKKAIQLNPNEGPAYSAITHSRKMGERDAGLVAQIRAGLESAKLRPVDRISFHFSLAKCLNDTGNYEEAMREYDRANELMHKTMLQGRPNDRTISKKIYEHAAAVYTPEFFAKYRSLGSESEVPIFIVGMIRSGTTLIEQILSSHPKVAPGGEIDFWSNVNVEVLGPSARIPDPEGLKRVQARYLKLLNKLALGSPRVTDKMPANYGSLGMIHLAFPTAKILHCKRDPIDTVLSIYMTPNSVPVNFGYVRENIVFAYKEYQRLMELYRKVIPEQSMLEVSYEDVVLDQENQTRAIMEFLGLEWDDACLHPEENQRAINTPTLWQARQPVYKTAVKKWKNYEPWLGSFSILAEE